MENLEQRQQALIAEITAAFDGVSREDGVSLSEAHVIDNYGNAEERAAARAEDTETRWQDVSDEHLGWSDAVLRFVDAKGFRYYLPAYMVWYLKYIDIPNDWNDRNFESLISHLTIHPIRLSQPRDNDEALSVYKSLTAAQSKAITHFLELQAEYEAEWKAESLAYDEEEWKREYVDNDAVSQEEADVALQELKQFQANVGLLGNDAQRALDFWWGQFL